MKRTILATLAMMLCIATTSLASPVIEFTPEPDTGGCWQYNGDGILSFNQSITVDRAPSNTDALVGAQVYLPTFQITGIDDENYTLTPLGSNQVTVKSADSSVTYMTGTLGSGDFFTVGTIAGGYTTFQTDITNIMITDAGEVLGSAALALISNMDVPSLDFELSLNGGSGPGYTSFAQMLSSGYTGSGNFSGAMTVPEPTTIALLGIGGLALYRKRRNLC